jgi:hypothetical protein
LWPHQGLIRGSTVRAPLGPLIGNFESENSYLFDSHLWSTATTDGYAYTYCLTAHRTVEEPMPLVRKLISWLTNHPTTEEIARALATDYLS